jgi:hypothetical protein
MFTPLVPIDTGSSDGRHPARTVLIFAVLAAGMPGAWAQQKLPPAAAEWTLSSPFAKDQEARMNLSGAACVPTAPPFTSCLIVNDQKQYAQFFALEGTTIVPGAVIRLVDKVAEGDPDAEGAAYDECYFYVVGSHGRSRHSNKPNDSSYVVFRFPVDKITGKPTFAVSEDKVVGVEASGRLREVIMNGDIIKDFYDQPLAKNGANIEGIAVKHGRMHLGLRGPSGHEHALIVSVDAAAAFTKDGDLKAAVRLLKLGKDTGIRDLASVRDGVLVLSGPVNDQPVEPAVFLWDDKSGALRKLAELQRPQGRQGELKAETLLVLDDSLGKAWRVLIMFDGQENGAPTEYLIPR